MWPGKKRILVVDDDPDITLTLSSVLEESGFDVAFFNNPLLPLRAFKPHYYDLVMLDIKMPEMNGFELYQQLKKKDNRVRVCFLTAITEFSDYKQYKKDVYPKPHERYYIAKPVSNDELIRRVNDILSNDSYHLTNT
jgi:DNA-binding response OmpR family regulator